MANKKGAQFQSQSLTTKFSRLWAAHVTACKLSFHNIAVSPLATMMTMLAIGVCLTLPISLFLGIKNVQNIGLSWQQNTALTVYLEPNTTSQQADQLIDKIKQHTYVNSAKLIPKQKALEEFISASGLKDVLGLLPENPLPDAISVDCKLSDGSTSELALLKAQLQTDPIVESVDMDAMWLENLKAFLGFGKALMYALSLLIGLGVILIVSNTIRLTLERHREEIEVMNLIGATAAFIRRPFVYRGLFYGLLGGLIATLIMNNIIYFLQRPANAVASIYHGVFVLDQLQVKDILVLLILSGGLGWLGAIVAFWQQFRSISKEGNY